MKKTMLLTLVTFFLCASHIVLASSSEEFTARCLELSVGHSGSTLSCKAKNQEDEKLLKSIGLDKTFEAKTDKIKVGNWEDGTRKYHLNLRIPVKRSLFGIGTKYMNIHCREESNGNIKLLSKNITVDIEDRHTTVIRANVDCR